MTPSQAAAYNLRLESSTIQIGEKGRITVPARFRKRLGIKKGDTFSIVQVDSFLILTLKELAPKVE